MSSVLLGTSFRGRNKVSMCEDGCSRRCVPSFFTCMFLHGCIFVEVLPLLVTRFRSRHRPRAEPQSQESQPLQGNLSIRHMQLREAASPEKKLAAVSFSEALCACVSSGRHHYPSGKPEEGQRILTRLRQADFPLSGTEYRTISEPSLVSPGVMAASRCRDCLGIKLPFHLSGSPFAPRATLLLSLRVLVSHTSAPCFIPFVLVCRI